MQQQMRNTSGVSGFNRKTVRTPMLLRSFFERNGYDMVV